MWKRKDLETVDAIGFRHLFDAHQTVANTRHVGCGSESDGECSAEYAVVGVEMNGFEHEIWKFTHRLRDAEEHAARIQSFGVNRRVV